MRQKNIIRIFSEPHELSILDRARYIVNNQSAISNYLGKFAWFLPDKTPVSLASKNELIQLFLDGIRKRIRRHTVLEEIPDDFFDNTSTVDGFYYSNKFDDETSFIYEVGGLIDGDNTESSLLIKNYSAMEHLTDFDSLRSFILMLVDLFDPSSIEVSEYSFYRGLMDLESDEYWFGWVSYFSKNIKLPQVPDEIMIERLPNGGKLLITTYETFNCSNSSHVRKAKLLVDLFRKENIKM